MGAAAVLVFTAWQVKPVFLDGPITTIAIPSATVDEKAMLLAPWSRLPFQDALATPVFLRDRNAFALSHLARRVVDRSPDTHWRTALLRYNGCVTGRNTPDCHTYPDVVRREVLRSARIICAGRNFDSCVITPLRLGARARS